MADDDDVERLATLIGQACGWPQPVNEDRAGARAVIAELRANPDLAARVLGGEVEHDDITDYAPGRKPCTKCGCPLYAHGPEMPGCVDCKQCPVIPPLEASHPTPRTRIRPVGPWTEAPA